MYVICRYCLNGPDFDLGKSNCFLIFKRSTIFSAYVKCLFKFLMRNYCRVEFLKIECSLFQKMEKFEKGVRLGVRFAVRLGVRLAQYFSTLDSREDRER